MPDTQKVETQKEVSGTVKFGLQGLQHPTPLWATYIFRTEFILNKVAISWLGATSLIQGTNLKETLLILAAIDTAVWLAARFTGVKKSDFETETTN